MAQPTAAQRRERLAELVIARGFVRVVDASAVLGVSEVTIRGDLAALDGAGRLTRTHGGAVPRGATPVEPTIEEAVSLASETKRAIGEHAASLVSSGQSLILDVGSTALAVAHALVNRAEPGELVDVTVITNGLSIALALEAAMPRVTVVLTGGTLRPLQHSLVNPGASSFLESVNVDIAFIGCNGVDLDHGVTNINYPEAEVKRRMLLSARRRVLVADGGKLGQTHLGVVGGIREFDLLITSGDGDPGVVAHLREAGLDVILTRSGRR